MVRETLLLREEVVAKQLCGWDTENNRPLKGARTRTTAVMLAESQIISTETNIRTMKKFVFAK